MGCTTEKDRAKAVEVQSGRLESWLLETQAGKELAIGSQGIRGEEGNAAPAQSLPSGLLACLFPSTILPNVLLCCGTLKAAVETASCL